MLCWNEYCHPCFKANLFILKKNLQEATTSQQPAGGEGNGHYGITYQNKIHQETQTELSPEGTPNRISINKLNTKYISEMEKEKKDIERQIELLRIEKEKEKEKERKSKDLLQQQLQNGNLRVNSDFKTSFQHLS